MKSKDLQNAIEHAEGVINNSKSLIVSEEVRIESLKRELCQALAQEADANRWALKLMEYCEFPGNVKHDWTAITYETCQEDEGGSYDPRYRYIGDDYNRVYGYTRGVVRVASSAKMECKRCHATNEIHSKL